MKTAISFIFIYLVHPLHSLYPTSSLMNDGVTRDSPPLLKKKMCFCKIKSARCSTFNLLSRLFFERTEPFSSKRVLPMQQAPRIHLLFPCAQVNGIDMSGRSQEELVAMLRSTKQGESVCVVVARQEDLFLPRELVRECDWAKRVPRPTFGWRRPSVIHSFLLTRFFFFLFLIGLYFFYVSFTLCWFFLFIPQRRGPSFVPVPSSHP